MGRWLAPLMGVLGLLAIVAGVAWAELDEGSMAGVRVVGSGALLLVVAGGLVAGVEGLTRRRHPRAPHPLTPVRWFPSRHADPTRRARGADDSSRAARRARGLWSGCDVEPRGAGDEDLGAVGSPGAPSAVWLSLDAEPWWTLVWCRSHSSAEFSSDVSPPLIHASRWWTSHQKVGAPQPANTHPPSRTSAARRMCGGTRRRLRP
jgi:hypothetical protein